MAVHHGAKVSRCNLSIKGRAGLSQGLREVEVSFVASKSRRLRDEDSSHTFVLPPLTLAVCCRLPACSAIRRWAEADHTKV